MRQGILFNALQASPVGAGVSRYAVEMARELTALRPDVCVAAQRGMAERLGADPARAILKADLTASWRRILSEQTALALAARRFRLVHYPDSIGPMLSSTRSILSVHDLSFMRHPELFTRPTAVWKRHATRISAGKAARILCPSRWTAEDVCELLGVPESSIRVIPYGVRLCPSPAAKPNLDLPPGPFILCVGTIEPRKNIRHLLKAVGILRDQGFPHKLLVAGKRGWKCGAILNDPALRELRKHMILAGYWDDAQLKWLYGKADVLAYVSLYEGFGFPPLEAMGYGLPVVASKSSCLPEVCGPAAHYVDPLSPEDIARGLREVLTDKDLRSRLTAFGAERVRLFDWRKTAEAVSRVYDEL